MATIYLSLGSNLGDRARHLREALSALSPEVETRKTSTVYETEPMYVGEQPRFYNLAVKAETELGPLALIKYVKGLERELGRIPSVENGPRAIDIDILFYDTLILETDELSIPHPRMHERAFVLVPLDEIAPLVEHPRLGRLVADLRSELGDHSGLVWPVRGVRL